MNSFLFLLSRRGFQAILTGPTMGKNMKLFFSPSRSFRLLQSFLIQVERALIPSSPQGRKIQKTVRAAQRWCPCCISSRKVEKSVTWSVEGSTVWKNFASPKSNLLIEEPMLGGVTLKLFLIKCVYSYQAFVTQFKYNCVWTGKHLVQEYFWICPLLLSEFVAGMVNKVNFNSLELQLGWPWKYHIWLGFCHIQLTLDVSKN